MLKGVHMTNNNKIQIIIKDNAYYMACDLSNELVYLCKKNELNDIYVNTHAEWTYNHIKRKKEYGTWKQKVST